MKPNPYARFDDMQAALINLGLTGGFSVYAGVDVSVLHESDDDSCVAVLSCNPSVSL